MDISDLLIYNSYPRMQIKYSLQIIVIEPNLKQLAFLHILFISFKYLHSMPEVIFSQMFFSLLFGLGKYTYKEHLHYLIISYY